MAVRFRDNTSRPIAVRDMTVKVTLAHGVKVARAIAAGERVPTSLIAAYEAALADGDTPAATTRTLVGEPEAVTEIAPGLKVADYEAGTPDNVARFVGVADVAMAEAVLAYEQAHEDRETVTRAAEARIAELAASSGSGEASDSGEGSGSGSGSGDAATGGDLAAELGALGMPELRERAKQTGISAPVGISKQALVEALVSAAPGSGE